MRIGERGVIAKSPRRSDHLNSALFAIQLHMCSAGESRSQFGLLFKLSTAIDYWINGESLLDHHQKLSGFANLATSIAPKRRLIGSLRQCRPPFTRLAVCFYLVL